MAYNQLAVIENARNFMKEEEAVPLEKANDSKKLAVLRLEVINTKTYTFLRWTFDSIIAIQVTQNNFGGTIEERYGKR